MGALIVQQMLAMDVVESREHIAERERGNRQSTDQIRRLETTVDRFIHRDDEQRFGP